MLVAEVKIKGTRPMMWHKFNPEALSSSSTGRKEKTGSAGNDPEEWKKTYTATKDGQLYLDPSYIFGCLREAAKYTKQGKGSIQKNVAATLQVLDDKVLIDRFMPEEITTDSNEDVYLDVRGVKNPATKGRNVRYRVTCSPGWTATFSIMWDASLVSRDQIKAVLIDAGQLVGLADGRSIGFGRFEVEDVQIEEYATKKVG